MEAVEKYEKIEDIKNENWEEKVSRCFVRKSSPKEDLEKAIYTEK